ncbi:hypothetical protein Gotur_005498 [Gossypium turneri]
MLDSQRKKLTERNNALEAMVMALKEETMATTMALSIRIEELMESWPCAKQSWGKECQVQHSVTRMSRSRKSLWGQYLHAMWTISCEEWKTTSVLKALWMMQLR